MTIVNAPGVGLDASLFDVCAGQWTNLSVERISGAGGSDLDALGQGMHLLYSYRVTPAGPYGTADDLQTIIQVEFDTEGLTQWPYDGWLALTGGIGTWIFYANTNENDGRENRSAEAFTTHEVMRGRSPEYGYHKRFRTLLTSIPPSSTFQVPAWHTRIGVTNGSDLITLPRAATLAGVAGSYPILPGTVVANEDPAKTVQIWTETYL